MGDLSRKKTVLGVEYGVRVCAQYSIACYYTEPYVVGVKPYSFSCSQHLQGYAVISVSNVNILVALVGARLIESSID